MANQLGILGTHPGAKVIVPGDTNRSILFRRVSLVGENQMPPLARNLVDASAVAVIGKWISQLPITAAILPHGWTSADIGNVGVSGEASFLNGGFQLLASGGDIWESADAFHFASRPLAGDGVIVARVAAMQYTDPWAKAGVMLRENDSAGAKYVFLAPDRPGRFGAAIALAGGHPDRQRGRAPRQVAALAQAGAPGKPL